MHPEGTPLTLTPRAPSTVPKEGPSLPYLGSSSDDLYSQVSFEDPSTFIRLWIRPMESWN